MFLSSLLDILYVLFSFLMFWCVLYLFFLMFFFFSSRRRHTRCSRDWSSDVCSSDLALDGVAPDARAAGEHFLAVLRQARLLRGRGAGLFGDGPRLERGVAVDHDEIGRASCRERV